MPRRVSVLVAFVSALAFAQEEPYGDAPMGQVPDIDGASEYGDRTWDYIKLSEEDMELFNLCESNTSGTPAQIRDVLERGASPSVQGEYNYTALMWTAVRGKTEQARILLEAGADTETINAWGRNALFIAAWEKRNGIVEAMIEYGANVTACADHDEWTALHKACELGNHKMVAMLLAAGADPLKRTLPTSTEERTPIGYAITPMELAKHSKSKKTIALIEKAVAEAEEKRALYLAMHGEEEEVCVPVEGDPESCWGGEAEKVSRAPSEPPAKVWLPSSNDDENEGYHSGEAALKDEV